MPGSVWLNRNETNHRLELLIIKPTLPCTCTLLQHRTQVPFLLAMRPVCERHLLAYTETHRRGALCIITLSGLVRCLLMDRDIQSCEMSQEEVTHARLITGIIISILSRADSSCKASARSSPREKEGGTHLPFYDY